ncbi:MAG: glycosyltransferase family 2 protein [Nanoarchaeota archaeon]|nr:glycosyltransferase family 2 protein [Nanoarchaeota archaeon]
MNPKVLVGSPVNSMYDYCIEEYVAALKSLTYTNYDILLIDNSDGDEFFKRLQSMGVKVIKDKHFDEPRNRQVSGRNLLREKALQQGYDYFLNLDQDVIPPKDIIERFLAHKRRVLTGIYFNYKQFTPKEKGSKEGIRHGQLFPTIWALLNQKGDLRQIQEHELQPPRVIQIGLCGSGCLFIHSSVLKKITFHYSKENDDPTINKLIFDDSYFCKDLINLKIPIYADTSMICRHLIRKKGWIWSDLTNKNI